MLQKIVYLYPNIVMSGKYSRIVYMAKHNEELIDRLKAKPEVVGILTHGGFSANPRHETDASSDLDLTVVIDSGYNAQVAKSSDPRTYIPWLNFKSYQFMNSPGEADPVEVDMYYFDMANDNRPWNNATKEGYSYSSSVVFDRNGMVTKWLQCHYELTQERREATIQELLNKANYLLEKGNTPSLTPIDQRIILSKVVKLLVECVFYINWTYPPDLKWRVSGTSFLDWKPSEFISLIGACNQTRELSKRLENINNLFEVIKNKLQGQGIEWTKKLPKSPKKSSFDNTVLIARLFTRIDKYSGHSAQKCIKRGLPWNAHDIISEGLENAVDIIYAINGVTPPEAEKYRGIKALEWAPANYHQYFWQASSILNYEDYEDASTRATALRELFIQIKGKLTEMNLFSTSSLYSENFMYEDLFTKTSPYMMVFKGGMYINRQQEKDTFAERICDKVILPHHEKNILFGLCSQYLIGSEKELLELNPNELHPKYRKVWDIVVNQLK